MLFLLTQGDTGIHGIQGVKGGQVGLNHLSQVLIITTFGPFFPTLFYSFVGRKWS